MDRVAYSLISEQLLLHGNLTLSSKEELKYLRLQLACLTKLLPKLRTQIGAGKCSQISAFMFKLVKHTKSEFKILAVVSDVLISR